MRVIRVIAANTFREALRDRILYLFLGFAVALLASSKLFGILTVGDQAKIIKDVGLAGIQFFLMLIAVMMSVLLISREVDSRTVYYILAKPVRRWQFLVGKVAGLVAVVLVNLALMTSVLLLFVWLYGGGFDPKLIIATAFIGLEMSLLVAFAALFSVLTRPILASVFTLAVFIVGHLSQDLWLLTRHLPGSLGRSLVSVVYYLVPNLERFNFKTEVVHQLPIPPAAVGFALIYGAAFTGLVLLLACLRFERKDLQ
ncbi:MAG: ABC transporter permease [Thermoanaerobaculales bacterium]|jgi:ABC-type transport system involved in multi-copper enzyme maturation permease subunit|nr:ABC transporter permease [Thermoanaerobaculales bacterium]